MSVVVLGSSIWFGYELSTVIMRNRLDYLVRFSIGIVLGMTIQASVFFITSVYLVLDLVHGIYVSLIFILLSLIMRMINRRYEKFVVTYSLVEIMILIPSCAFVCWGAYICNIEQGFYIRGPSYADLPFHMNIISSFSHGINVNRSSIFDVWSSFQANISLAYPMFHNFYIAALMNCGGLSLPLALQWTAIPLVFSFIILFHSLSLHFTSDRLIAALSIPSWILLGGLGWTMIFYNGIEFNRDVNWIGHLGMNNSAFWMQPLIHILLPQRSAMFSLPLCMTTLICFMKASSDFSSLSSFPYFLLSGICTGFLPQLQVHSFAALAQFSIALCLLFLPKVKRFWPYFFMWLIYGVISCSIGIPLSYPFWIRKKESPHILTIQALWGDDVYGPLPFPIVSIWWKGIGPFAYVMLLFGWVAASQWQMRFWGASMIVWFITSFVRYQPWAMDNLKLLFAVWVPIAVPYVTQFYVWTMRKAKKQKAIILIIVFLMVQSTFSSLLCFMSEIFKQLIFLHKEDYDCGNWISENTPVKAILMSYSSRFNPATSLSGRQLYLGFINWIAQHGVHGPNRLLKQNELLESKWNSKLWDEEGVHYVLTHKKQDLKFPLGLNDYNSWEIIFVQEEYTLYSLIFNNSVETKSEEKLTKNRKKNTKMRNKVS